MHHSINQSNQPNNQRQSTTLSYSVTLETSRAPSQERVETQRCEPSVLQTNKPTQNQDAPYTFNLNFKKHPLGTTRPTQNPSTFNSRVTPPLHTPLSSPQSYCKKLSYMAGDKRHFADGSPAPTPNALSTPSKQASKIAKTSTKLFAATLPTAMKLSAPGVLQNDEKQKGEVHILGDIGQLIGSTMVVCT